MKNRQCHVNLSTGFTQQNYTLIGCPIITWDWAKYQNRHSSKSIWVTKLLFCQNDYPMGGSFWQKDSLITHILFELLMIFSPILNLMLHSLWSKLNFNYYLWFQNKLMVISEEHQILSEIFAIAVYFLFVNQMPLYSVDSIKRTVHLAFQTFFSIKNTVY